MESAIWLLIGLPRLFFRAVATPFSGDALTLLINLATASLAVGLTVGVIKRERRLFFFGIPVAASELFVAAAGLFRGKITSESAGWPIMIGFLIFELATVSYGVYRLEGLRWTAALFAFFAVTYALFAYFLAAMSFSDNWI